MLVADASGATTALWVVIGVVVLMRRKRLGWCGRHDVQRISFVFFVTDNCGVGNIA